MSSRCSRARSHWVSHNSSSSVLPPAPPQVRLLATAPLGASCHLLRVSSVLCALCRVHWARSLPLWGQGGGWDGRQGRGESLRPNMSVPFCMFLDLRLEAVALEEALIAIRRKEEERRWLVSTGKPLTFSGSHFPNPQEKSNNSVGDNNTRVAPLAKETICQRRRCSQNRLVAPVTGVDRLPSSGSMFLDQPCEMAPATVI